MLQPNELHRIGAVSGGGSNLSIAVLVDERGVGSFVLTVDYPLDRRSKGGTMVLTVEDLHRLRNLVQRADDAALRMVAEGLVYRFRMT